MGIEESELLKKSRDDFLHEGLQIPHEFIGEADYFLNLKEEFYEKKRLEKVRLLLDERDKMIQDNFERDIGMKTNFSSSGQTKGKMNNQRFLEKEKQKLDKMVEKKVNFDKI